MWLPMLGNRPTQGCIGAVGGHAKLDEVLAVVEFVGDAAGLVGGIRHFRVQPAGAVVLVARQGLAVADDLHQPVPGVVGPVEHLIRLRARRHGECIYNIKDSRPLIRSPLTIVLFHAPNRSGRAVRPAKNWLSEPANRFEAAADGRRSTGQKWIAP